MPLLTGWATGYVMSIQDHSSILLGYGHHPFLLQPTWLLMEKALCTRSAMYYFSTRVVVCSTYILSSPPSSPGHPGSSGNGSTSKTLARVAKREVSFDVDLSHVCSQAALRIGKRPNFIVFLGDLKTPKGHFEIN